MWCELNEVFTLKMIDYQCVLLSGRVAKYKFTILQVQDKNQLLGLNSLKGVDVMASIGH